MPYLLKRVINVQRVTCVTNDIYMRTHTYAGTRDVLRVFSFADIYRWGGSSSQFSLIIWNTASESTFELKLATAQAADMAGIILDYINAIMQATQQEG